jgi:phosphoserine phosphatase
VGSLLPSAGDPVDPARSLPAAMRLVVQHPALPGTAVDAFAARVGRAPSLLEPGLAVWQGVDLAPEEVLALAQSLRVDAALAPQEARLADYRLLAFDMDSTLITIECVDEIADYAGCKAQVAAITEAAMRGEIADYDESLRRRVALLAGVDFAVLARVFDERLRLSPGAQPLIDAARRLGLKTLLVSGGFTYFTGRLKAQLDLDYTRSNTVEVVDGKLTGRVLGPIVNAQAKAQALLDICDSIGCTPGQSIALGDGANDLKMMAIAGVSVAYHAKPVVRAQTTYAINYCGLDAVLNLLPAS